LRDGLGKEKTVIRQPTVRERGRGREAGDFYSSPYHSELPTFVSGEEEDTPFLKKEGKTSTPARTKGKTLSLCCWGRNKPVMWRSSDSEGTVSPFEMNGRSPVVSMGGRKEDPIAGVAKSAERERSR